MKYITLFVLVFLVSCKSEVEDTQSTKVISVLTNTGSERSQDLEIYDFDGLEPLLNKKDDQVHVVNFWATWCGPCIKELPYFETINKKYKAEGVDVLLVSLDFPSKYETQLKPYIKKNNLQSKVVAFDDINQNRWIPAIHENWSGAIPATIIYTKDKRQFYEKSFTLEELEIELNKFLKN